MLDSGRFSRRRFLKQSGAALASSIVMPHVIPSGVLARDGRPGVNDRVVMGFIGTGGRARQLMDHVPDDGRIVAICDCYQQRYIDTLKQKGTDWKTYQYYQKMFDNEQLDAVVVATPDHARVLPCIHACQAGLDVYAEKPLTLTIAEGRMLVNAVREAIGDDMMLEYRLSGFDAVKETDLFEEAVTYLNAIHTNVLEYGKNLTGNHMRGNILHI